MSNKPNGVFAAYLGLTILLPFFVFMMIYLITRIIFTNEAYVIAFIPAFIITMIMAKSRDRICGWLIRMLNKP